MKKVIRQAFSDKNGNISLRETVTGLFVLITLISWVGKQFFGFDVPEYMFFSFISLIGAGGFGYSIERKCTALNTPNENPS